MTANQLMEVLKIAIDAGEGDCDVLFDSDAQCFKVHLVEIKSAYFQPEKDSGNRSMVTLHYSWLGHVNPMHKDSDEEMK